MNEQSTICSNRNSQKKKKKGEWEICLTEISVLYCAYSNQVKPVSTNLRGWRQKQLQHCIKSWETGVAEMSVKKKRYRRRTREDSNIELEYSPTHRKTRMQWKSVGSGYGFSGWNQERMNGDGEGKKIINNLVTVHETETGKEKLRVSLEWQ